MKLRYTPDALADLDEIHDYIANELKNPAAAKRVIVAIARDCDRLRMQPYMGLEIRKKTGYEINGRCLVSNMYMVIYDVREEISVLRIVDTRLDYIRILTGMKEN